MMVIITAVSVAQEAPGDAIRITCKTDISYKYLCGVLIKSGIPISSSDKDGGYVVTEYAESKRGYYRMMMSLHEGVVDVVGLFKIDEVDFSILRNKGQGKSPNKLAFSTMDSFVKDNLQCTEISYTVSDK